MPRKRVPCAGQCGRLIQIGTGSLPAGRSMCRECRSIDRSERVATCQVCGDEFPSPGEAVYCSTVCRGATLSPRGVSRHRVCEVCEAPYVASYGDQRTCGRTCGAVLQAESRPPKPIEERTWPSCKIFAGYCQQCGQAFTSGIERRTCSLKCANRLYNAQARPPACRCPGCGDSIPADRRKCDPCLARHRATRKRQDKRRRRALKLGVATERYTLVEIAARDRFKCGICRTRVDMARTTPHPEAPTVDHVVPLARGGDDTRANVQLAHFLCNSRKSDGGGGEQLALVG